MSSSSASVQTAKARAGANTGSRGWLGSLKFSSQRRKGKSNTQGSLNQTHTSDKRTENSPQEDTDAQPTLSQLAQRMREQDAEIARLNKRIASSGDQADPADAEVVRFNALFDRRAAEVLNARPLPPLPLPDATTPPTFPNHDNISPQRPAQHEIPGFSRTPTDTAQANYISHLLHELNAKTTELSQLREANERQREMMITLTDTLAQKDATILQLQRSRATRTSATADPQASFGTLEVSVSVSQSGTASPAPGRPKPKRQSLVIAELSDKLAECHAQLLAYKRAERARLSSRERLHNAFRAPARTSTSNATLPQGKAQNQRNTSNSSGRTPKRVPSPADSMSQGGTTKGDSTTQSEPVTSSRDLSGHRSLRKDVMGGPGRNANLRGRMRIVRPTGTSGENLPSATAKDNIEHRGTRGISRSGSVVRRIPSKN